MDKKRSFVGIDEVGRGPLAGPVCLCAFSFTSSPSKINYRLRKVSQGENLPFRDSKKLSRIQREVWFSHIKKWQKEGHVDFSVSYVSAAMIDRIGISKAIKKALSRSLYNMNTGFLQPIFLDGGLQAPSEFINQRTIIKGDEKHPVIALASIVAKVHRDRLMVRQAKRFPGYGFESHVGYGTKQHYKAIKKLGITPLHRESFLKNK